MSTPVSTPDDILETAPSFPILTKDLLQAECTRILLCYQEWHTGGREMLRLVVGRTSSPHPTKWTLAFLFPDWMALGKLPGPLESGLLTYTMMGHWLYTSEALRSLLGPARWGKGRGRGARRRMSDLGTISRQAPHCPST